MASCGHLHPLDHLAFPLPATCLFQYIAGPYYSLQDIPALLSQLIISLYRGNVLIPHALLLAVVVVDCRSTQSTGLYFEIGKP